MSREIKPDFRLAMSRPSANSKPHSEPDSGQLNPGVAVVVLAAGHGRRMNSSLPKVLNSAYGKPLITRVLETAAQIVAPERITVVVGVGRAEVSASVGEFSKKISSAIQEPQRGTGDAVKSALAHIDPDATSVLVLYGDVPLLKTKTLQGLLHHHRHSDSTITFLTLKSSADTGYGRVIRNAAGCVTGITELRDCNPSEVLIDELNTGVMVIDSAFLAPALSELQNNNSQKEYYLTDIVARAVKEGQRVSTLTLLSALEVQGVNTPQDLAVVDSALMKQRVAELAMQGVTFTSTDSVWIGPQVQIGARSSIGPGCELNGKTILAEDVTLEGYARLENCSIGKNSVVKWCTRAEGSVIGENCNVGPFAHLRPGTELSNDVKIGNFVETKNAKLGIDSKASHLTYLGDTVIGKHVNIGAGTITCNYDGKNKFQTTIHDGVFIGSNSSLVAPVEIGENATIGAGSVITKRVEPNSLALGRAKQIEKLNWKSPRSK